MLQQLTQLAQTYTTYTYSYTPQGSNNAAAAGLAVGMLVFLLIIAVIVGLFFIICNWKIFTKANKPGWASIIPIYNTWVFCEVAGKPGWWSLLITFIPIVNIVLAIIVYIEISKKFGKDPIFALLLIFLPIIGLPILAFGKAQYMGSGSASNGANSPSAMSPTPQAPQPPVVQ